MRQRPAQPVVIAALTSVLLWSSAFVAIRFVGRQLGPGPLSLARLAVGSLALGAVMLIRRERLPRGRAAGLAALSGLLWFGVYNLALNAAERRIDAGTSALLVNTGPIFLAFLAGAVGSLAIGFGTWAFALARSSAGRLGVTTYLVPPLVVLISWIALGETPPWLALPGGLLCLAGVALTRRRPTARRAESHPAGVAGPAASRAPPGRFPPGRAGAPQVVRPAARPS